MSVCYKRVKYPVTPNGVQLDMVESMAGKWLLVWHCLMAVVCANSEDVKLTTHLDWKKMFEETVTLLDGKKHCLSDQHLYTCSSQTKSVSATAAWNIKSVCDCGEECMTYGACCIDKAGKKWDEGLLPQDKFKCSYLDEQDSLSGVQMVGKCGASFINSSVEPLCLQTPPHDAYTHMLDIPVISLDTQVVYVNYYCAVCNDDSSNLSTTVFHIQCQETARGRSQPLQLQTAAKNVSDDLNVTEFLSTAIYLPGERKWKAPTSLSLRSDTYNNTTCVLKKIDYDQKETLSSSIRSCTYPVTGCRQRRCPSQVSRCDKNWPNEEDAAKCRSYTMRLFDRRNNRAYKNPHCAHCNSVNLSSPEISCKRQYFVREATNYRPPSLSMLFSLAYTPWEKCEKGKLWNPESEQCEDFVCGTLYKKSKRGRCIPITRAQSNSSSGNTVAEKRCPKVYISYTASNLVDNSSLIINERVYKYGDYGLLNGTTAWLCAGRASRQWTMKLDTYTSFIVCLISEVCLALHIILFVRGARTKTYHEINLLCLCISLLLAQAIFLFGIDSGAPPLLCFTLSVLIYFFWLAAFFWMNILSIDIFRTFSRKFTTFLPYSKAKSLRVYSLYAWGVPLVLVLLAILTDTTNIAPYVQPKFAHGHEPICWFNSKIGLGLFFLAPIGIVVIGNVVLFIMTSLGIYQQMKEARFAHATTQSIRRPPNDSHTSQARTHSNKQKQNKIRFALYAKLGLLQGFAWVLGFVAVLLDSDVVWEIFTVVNGLQGAMIFIIFDLTELCMKTVWKAIASTSFDWRTSSRDTKSLSLSTPRSQTTQDTDSRSRTNEETTTDREVI